MSLNSNCTAYIGKTLKVEPIHGYGWFETDTLTKGLKSLDQLPPPFAMKYMEPTFIDNVLFGGIGYITEPEHPHFHQYLRGWTKLSI